ncbi:hypothetical protein PHLGIDRAFT_73780 [Phlebiopsis gigantea 11061_1 CR5-6]|uniref:AB hydrolase-1 domain-containing protein n=1 Tax=Phlebiopsis gigantea (strain 11061_1 CR5-6) TaxID=745531 RepID=A0A0C3S8X4_PHLG1|nr:hypothetical protein PHLGIDRAFT_73780 [Phlebiopsis gigantea 11061_1 CR5-6]
MSQSKLGVSLDGTRVYANAVGDPANPALVFVHGFSADSSNFNSIFDNTDNTREFFLVRYDTRGAGRTGKPSTAESYTSDKFAQDFAAVMDAFQLKRPILDGWSMGALVANDIVCYLPPGTLTGTVALAGAPYVDLSVMAAFDTLSAPIRMAMFGEDPIAAEQANLAFNRYYILIRNDFAGDNPAVTWEMRCNLLGTASLMRRDIRRLVGTRTQDNTKLLDAAKQGFPLLLITKNCDPAVRGDVLANALRESFTNIQLKTVKNGSHTLFLDAPHEIMGFISAFAKTV